MLVSASPHTAPSFNTEQLTRSSLSSASPAKFGGQTSTFETPEGGNCSDLRWVLGPACRVAAHSRPATPGKGNKHRGKASSKL